MDRALILGTAGHVDHGKTALVRALTGVDTDRLEEEHRRGISIELGFAHLDLGDGLRFGIVDVPGHERFVRQMVAGAGGMDLAMLLVAADEGIMPQTREHLDVLRFLGVPAGLIVLTKMDLADPDLVEVVESEVAELVEGSFLEDAPMLRVSAQAGTGLDELKTALRTLARTAPLRSRAGSFRLPVDRVFVLQGTGAVVTGTAWSGEVAGGGSLRLLPQDTDVRVREVQSHGAPVEKAGAGERVALALHGVKREDLSRGDQLVSGAAWEVSHRLGVRVHSIADAQFAWALKHRARVHVHHAAREVLGRLDVLDGDAVPPGGTGLVRIHLEEPLVAAPGDRLVLRSYSPMVTVAGGVVLDPFLPAGERRADAAAWLAQVDGSTTEEWPWMRVRRAGADGLSADGWFAAAEMAGLDRDAAEAGLQARLEAGDLVRLGDRLVGVEPSHAARDRALELARAHQDAQPMSPGLSKEELRSALGLNLTAPQFTQLLAHWAGEAPLFDTGERVRADSATPQLDAAQRAAVEELRARVDAAQPLWQATAAEARSPELHLLLGEGYLERLDGPLYATRERLDDLRRRTEEHFAQHDTLEVSHVKEWTGASRKFAVPMLEWLDAQGLTRFDGKVRRQAD